MSLALHKPAPIDSPALAALPAEPVAPIQLLVDINTLAVMVSRSVPSLRRDDSAGRIPAGLRIGGAKRWRAEEIRRWVEAGCPDRKAWNALNTRK